MEVKSADGGVICHAAEVYRQKSGEVCQNELFIGGILFGEKACHISPQPKADEVAEGRLEDVRNAAAFCKYGQSHKPQQHIKPHSGTAGFFS